jgi:hypothetical protein
MPTSDLSSLDDPIFRRELLVVASFLAGYGTSTRNSYATDLRLFADWCRDYGLNLFEVRRSRLELFGRSMEARGLMASTVARRLSALASFYRYCEEGHVDRSPATHVRRPKVDNESRTLGLDRNELSAFVIQAGIGTNRELAQARHPGLDDSRRGRPSGYVPHRVRRNTPDYGRCPPRITTRRSSTRQRCAPPSVVGFPGDRSAAVRRDSRTVAERYRAVISGDPNYSDSACSAVRRCCSRPGAGVSRVGRYRALAPHARRARSRRM